MSQVTKRALEASLKKLLLEKPLHKITVSDITEDCGINRMTFYYHFKAVLDNKPFILNVYRSVSREQVETYLYKLTYDLLEGVVEEQAQGMSVRQEDKDFIATLYKYMFVGLMLDWVKSDMKGDPHTMVERLEQVVHGSIRAALERLRSDRTPSDRPE